MTGNVQADGKADGGKGGKGGKGGGKPGGNGPAAPAPVAAAVSITITITNSTIKGDVHVNNANLDLVGATVGGNVQADQATGVAITGSTVSGDVHVTNASGATSVTSPNVVCNSVVLGNLQIENSSATAPWSIGGAGCASDVTGSTGSVVAGDFHFNGNAATNNDVSNNMVGHNLECNGNGGVIGSGRPNLVAGDSKGQCSSSHLPGD